MPDFLVDAVATANVDPNAPPATIDAFSLVAGTSTVALVGQTNGAENGIYDHTALGALARNATYGAAANMVYPTVFGVRNGSADNKHSEWGFDNEAAPAIGTDDVVINKTRHPRALEASGGLTRSGPDLSVATTGIPPGSYSRATFNARGQATSGESPEEAATFFEGLEVVRLSANSLRVREGSAYVPGAGRVLDLALDVDLTGLALTANTWYYLYAHEEEGALVVDPLPSPQRPASPYRGAARVKGGGTGGVLDNTNPDIQPDASKRYVPNSAFYAWNANQIRRFRKLPSGLTMHLGGHDVAASSGGTRVLTLARTPAAADSPLAADLSPLVPPTSRVAEAQGSVQYVSASSGAFLRHSQAAGLRLRYLATVRAAATDAPFTVWAETDDARAVEVVTSSANQVDVGLACTAYMEEV